MKYIFCTAVILFEFYNGYFIIVFLKLQDILNGCSTEAIDALSIISHYANIFVHGSQ